MYKKLTKIFLALVFCSLLINSAIASTDKIVAIVNNSVITQSEVDREATAIKQHLEPGAAASINDTELHKKVLDSLINKSLQLQIAERNNVTVSDKEVTDAIMGIAVRNKLTLAQLQQELVKQGLNYKDYRKQIHDDMIINRVSQEAVGAKISVNEQEVDAYLHKANSKMTVSQSGGMEYHLLDVLVPTSAKPGDKEYDEAKKVVDDVLAQLRKGKLVEEIVKKTTFDDKPLVGSDLGWRPINELPEQFKSVVAQLKIRDSAGPIVAPNGMHVVMLLDIRKASGLPGGVAGITRDEARQMVYRDKMERALKPWLQQLRATAYIKIMDNNANSANNSKDESN